MEVAKQLKAFEDTKYFEWRFNVENVLPEILKTNILVKARDKPNANLVMPINTNPHTGIFKIKDTSQFKF